MSNKLKYLLYAGATFLFIFIAGFLYTKSLEFSQLSESEILWQQLLIFGSSFGFGIILGMDKIFELAKVQGDWIFNKAKFISVGIPCTSITILYLMTYSQESSHSFLFLPRFMLQSGLLEVFVEALLGYIIISSFNKVEI